MSWRRVRLADIVSMRTGKLDSNAAVPDGYFPFFTCSQQTLRIDTPAFDTKAVLLGGNNAAGVFPLKYYEGQFNAYQRTYVIESCDPATLNIRFLFYSLRPALSHFQSVSIGAATQYLTKGILDNFQVALPSISEQDRIASILSAYDDLIENNRRRIQLLEQAARLLYKEWFIHLRFPGHEHVKIVDGVPEGWEKVPLSKLCKDVRESVNPKDLPPGAAYIGLEHMPRRAITLGEWGMANEVNSTKFKFAQGDILFGKIRPYFHKVGFTLTDGIASSDAIVIRPKEKFLYHYVLCLLSSDEFVALASKTVREGSKMPRADWKFLIKSEFNRPSESLIGLFSDVVNPICIQLRNLTLYNRLLTQARDLLLPRLMNGELAA